MILKIKRESNKGSIEIELDTARDSARIEDEARKLNLLDKDKVTTDVFFRLAIKLSDNLIRDLDNE